MEGISTRLARSDTGTRQHLQHRLMGFVDRAMSRLEEATDTIVFSTTNPEVRSAAHETKYYTLLAMVSLAADLRPEVALIDLMVMTRLERSKWAEPWCAEFMGLASAQQLQAAQSDIERDIWGIGAEYLSPEELERLRGLVDEWRTANPDRRYLTRVRLDSLAQMRGGEDFKRRVTGGFFAPVTEAAAAAEEVRLLGERAMYVAERTPLLVAWQAEVLAYDLARTPEALRMQDYLQAIKTAVQEGSEALTRLEAGQAGDGGGGYQELLSDTRDLLARADETSAKVRDTLHAGSELVERTDILLDEVNATLATVTSTAERFMPGSRESGGQAAEPAYRTTVEALTTAVEELNELVRQTDALLKSAVWNQRISEVDDAARARVDHAGQKAQSLIDQAYRRGLTLIAVAGATVLGVALVLRLAPKRSPVRTG